MDGAVLFPGRHGEESGGPDGLQELVEAVIGATNDGLLSAGADGHEEPRPGEPGEEPAGRVVPQVDPLLDVPVERALGDMTEVERAGAVAPDVADLGQEPRGSGRTSIVTSANCPWPPDCFLWRARWVRPRWIVSR